MAHNVATFKVDKTALSRSSEFRTEGDVDALEGVQNVLTQAHNAARSSRHNSKTSAVHIAISRDKLECAVHGIHKSVRR